MSKAALAAAAGVEPATIARLEAGAGVSAATIEAVATALGVETGVLWAAYQSVREDKEEQP
jgi:transcriptional regulator with XRE-family HTH domain